MDLTKTALVMIDLQQGILFTGEWAPYSGEDILAKNEQLAAALNETAALITLVNVEAETFRYLYPYHELGDTPVMDLPDDYSKLVMKIATDETAKNIVKITKHNPSAFFGTDLDLQLRRRGIDTLILTGVSTSNGVYATALDAYQHGYHLIIVEDACSDREQELFEIFFKKLIPKLGRVMTTTAILAEIQN